MTKMSLIRIGKFTYLRDSFCLPLCISLFCTPCFYLSISVERTGKITEAPFILQAVAADRGADCGGLTKLGGFVI
ncbi:MAG: hypothetical protein LBD07_00260 [Spirochaetaceae bacterium]|jgi:hypothetical protein|nr:hypothetical protein [Spirochaetaceae bacterium]